MSFKLQYFMPYLLTQAAEASALDFQKIYKEKYGILRSEWRVLFHLGAHGSMTAKQIAQMSNTHKTKVSRAVQRLEERRFLTRTRDTVDRRQEHLSLTSTGTAAFVDLREIAKDYNEKLLKSFSSDEIDTLRNMLSKLAGDLP